MMFNELEPRSLLGLHREIATGHHPDHGAFRVLQSLHDESIFVEVGDRKFAAPLRKIIDMFFLFFEQLERVNSEDIPEFMGIDLAAPGSDMTAEVPVTGNRPKNKSRNERSAARAARAAREAAWRQGGES